MNKADWFLLIVLAGIVFVAASASARAFEVFAIVLIVLIVCDRLNEKLSSHKKSHS
jgi:hypothetical protein